MEKLSAFFASPWFNAISFLVGIIGLILAYVFYRRALILKEPRWAGRNINLIEGYSATLSGLEISYNNAAIENLSVCRIVFWNNGRLTIDRNDLSTADPLRIKGRGNARILDAKLITSNNPSNQIAVNIQGDEAVISFDYLDKNQGAVIQIVHTGLEMKDLSLVGSIKGANGLRSTRIRTYRYLPLPTPASFDKRFKPSTIRKIRAFIIALVSLVFIFLGGYTFIQFTQSGNPRSSDIILVAACAFYSFAAMLMSYTMWFIPLPRGLEVFEEDPVR